MSDFRMLSDPNLQIFLAVVALALFGFYRFMYARERRHARELTAGQTWLLWGFRGLVALLALAALARPATREVRVEERLPVTAILIDASDSMNLATPRGNDLVTDLERERRKTKPGFRASRWESARLAVEKLVDELSLSQRVRVYGFGDRLDLVAAPRHRASREEPAPGADELFRRGDLPVTAGAPCSRCGQAIHDVLERLAGEKIGSLVLISDFQETGRVSTDIPLERMVERLRERNKEFEAEGRAPIRVHTLTEGTRFPLPDIRIDEVSGPMEASLGDVLQFIVTITNDYQDRFKTRLSLEEKSLEPDAPARKKEYQRVALKEVELSRGRNVITVATIPGMTGRCRYRFRIPPDKPAEGEIDEHLEPEEQNNWREKTVEIRKRSLRVLLIADRPSREYFYLVPALLRDPIVRLSCYLQSADVDYIHQGNQTIDALPETTEEWSRYDVAILFDVDPTKISVPQLNGLDAMVRDGGGLMIIAGRNNGLADLIQVHAVRIRGLLPMEIDKNVHPNYDKIYKQSSPARRTDRGRDHSIMLASTMHNENEKVWSRFPEFFWHAPIVRPKSDTVVLLETGGARHDPLMGVRICGEGTVFFSAVDAMWRWRYPYESYEYDRFWIRVIRYLGEVRLHGARTQVALEVEPRTVNPHEEVRIYLKVLDTAMMSTLRGEQVYARVYGKDQDVHMVRLKPPPEGGTEYRGTYRARGKGEITCQVRKVPSGADTEQKALFDVKTHFEIKVQPIELKNTAANVKVARALAERTGGVNLSHRERRAEDFDRLIEGVDKSKKQMITPVTLQLWDTVPFLVLFLVLISGEWSLRKWWGLL
ncbi:MAG: VWA domain-containing protein [Planctomycetota bacterium]